MKIIRKIGIGLLLALWAVLSLSLWFGPKADYTYAERRQLAQMPEFSVRSILWGEFMEDFEDFTLDQFPMRDTFRKVNMYKLFSQEEILLWQKRQSAICMRLKRTIPRK